MKFRSGFVSNSSSSSFVIMFPTEWFEDKDLGIRLGPDPKFLADRKSIDLLKGLGFRWSKKGNPLELELSEEGDFYNPMWEYTDSKIKREYYKRKKSDDFRKYLGNTTYMKSLSRYREHCKDKMAYQVACNEYEVIVFLLKNNIPFTAATHYGDYIYMYAKDEKYFLEISIPYISLFDKGEYNSAMNKLKKNRNAVYLGHKARRILVEKFIKQEDSFKIIFDLDAGDVQRFMKNEK